MVPIKRYAMLVTCFAAVPLHSLAAQQDAAVNRIRQQVEAIAAGDSITHRRAAIEARLRSIGLEPKLAWFDPPANVRAGRRGANIVADLPKRSNQVLLLGAHYDRVSVGRGVIDNAAGVATVLELAEAFARRPLAHYTVRVALFDLEEAGLLGSRAMVLDSAKTPLPELFLNFDIFGYGDAFWVGAKDSASALPRALRRAAQSHRIPLSIDSMYPPSDHLSFRPTRTPSIAISLLDGKDIDKMLARFRSRGDIMPEDTLRIMSIIHSPGDTMDKLDPVAMARGVRVVEEAIRALDAARGKQ
jgi:aminopeptidase S